MADSGFADTIRRAIGSPRYAANIAALEALAGLEAERDEWQHTAAEEFEFKQELAFGLEAASSERDALAAVLETTREALSYMADYEMTGTEMTLHIDFQGRARAALARLSAVSAEDATIIPAADQGGQNE